MQYGKVLTSPAHISAEFEAEMIWQVSYVHSHWDKVYELQF